MLTLPNRDQVVFQKGLLYYWNSVRNSKGHKKKSALSAHCTAALSRGTHSATHSHLHHGFSTIDWSPKTVNKKTKANSRPSRRLVRGAGFDMCWMCVSHICGTCTRCKCFHKQACESCHSSSFSGCILGQLPCPCTCPRALSPFEDVWSCAVARNGRVHVRHTHFTRERTPKRRVEDTEATRALQ